MRTRRGLTFLEVVAAMVMVSAVSAMILGAIGYLKRAADRERFRLDAMEVAHRIVLAHIDDRTGLRQAPKRVNLNGVIYHYDLVEELLVQETLSEDEEGEAVKFSRRAVRASDVAPTERLTERLHRVTVEVYLDPDEYPRLGGATLAELDRVFDPYGQFSRRVLRNLLDQFSGQLDNE